MDTEVRGSVPSSLDIVLAENTSLTRPLSLCSKNLRPLVVTMPALSCPRCCSISSPSNSSGLTVPCEKHHIVTAQQSTGSLHQISRAVLASSAAP